jgi:hypothetical protein
MNETESVFDWAERMISSPGWEEHEGAAWTGTQGAGREGGPSLEFSMRVVTAPRPPHPPTPRVPFRPHDWWKWSVRVKFGGVQYRDKYKASGHVLSMADGKAACEQAMLRLIAGFRRWNIHPVTR